jgi:ubiquitin-protein ligase
VTLENDESALDSREPRLRQDREAIASLTRTFPQFSAEPLEGTPPHLYRLCLRLPGYVSETGTIATDHRVKLRFPSGYPRNDPPRFDFESSPVFHPNVAASGFICLGFGGQQKWHYGYRTEDLIARLVEIIVFVTDDPTAFNPESPARSGVNWKAWASCHKTPLYDGPIFPTGIRRKLVSQSAPPALVRVRRVLHAGQLPPTAAAHALASRSAAPLIRVLRFIR